MVEEGKPAPDFELKTDEGESVRLSDFRGRPVVLYFYPKDDTPGCTKQACGIRDSYGEFERRGAVVLGVSPDKETSHVKFKEKYGLPFTLLTDRLASGPFRCWSCALGIAQRAHEPRARRSVPKRIVTAIGVVLATIIGVALLVEIVYLTFWVVP